MLTKGIITYIDQTSNKYTIDIPVFHSSNSKIPTQTIEAAVSIPPGVFGGYTINDVVWVEFEHNNISQPVIIGKLFLGNIIENDNRGAGSFNALTINGKSLTVKEDDKIIYSEDSQITKTLTRISEGDLTVGKTLYATNLAETNTTNIIPIKLIINKLKYITEEQPVGIWINNSVIYQKIFTYTGAIGTVWQEIGELTDFDTIIKLDKLVETPLEYIDGLQAKVSKTDKKVYIRSSTSYEAGQVKVIIEYTKTE